MKLNLLVLALSLAAALPGLAQTGDYTAFPSSVASGDPTSDSVILWTRVAAESGAPDQGVSLEVATDEAFTNVIHTRDDLLARADFDYTLKVRVSELQPYTYYFYRFTWDAKVSPVGRTKTAPAAGADVNVRFAFLSCQDYIGRYYNALRHLIEHEDESLDFVIFLGDYIYETTGDPQFQSSAPDRLVTFSDPQDAIELGTPPATFLAASSLENYRDIYRIYRNDPWQRRLHERFPLMIIWDDHEYSDDNWQDVATFLNERADEQDPQRKRNAEQAFFEYAPIGVGVSPENDGTSILSGLLYPNTVIYGERDFGANLRLVLTDYRSFRPDHMIPESAFPGTIAVPQEALQQILGEPGFTALSASFDPYLNIDDEAFAAIKQGLIDITVGGLLQDGFSLEQASAYAVENVTGSIGTTFIASAFALAGQPNPLSAEFIATLPRGLSFLYMGKTGFFSDVGSRYFVVRDSYRLYAAYRGLLDASSQDGYGQIQSGVIATALATSTASWNVLVSSVSHIPIGVDFAEPPFDLGPDFPATFRQAFQLNVDHWDGFPNARQNLIDLYAQFPTVIISGDIHANYAARHFSTTGGVVPEFTGTSVTSQTFGEISRGLAGPVFGDLPGLDTLIDGLDTFIADAINNEPATELLLSDSFANGYTLIEARPDELHAIYRSFPTAQVFTQLYDEDDADTLNRITTEKTFLVTRTENQTQVTPGNAAAAILPGATLVGEAQVFTPWMGFANSFFAPWIWNSFLGWAYTFPGPSDGVYLWIAEDTRWTFTHPTFFPWHWDFASNQWDIYGN